MLDGRRVTAAASTVAMLIPIGALIGWYADFLRGEEAAHRAKRAKLIEERAREIIVASAAQGKE